MPINVTVITPVAGYHTHFVPQVQASVNAQTVPVNHIIRIDERGVGPAVLRNAMISDVTTPFVVFLDADDRLDPRFIERTLEAWQTHHYVYTDWWQDTTYKAAPDRAWCGDGQWHVITTLLPTEAVRQIGGFDESLPGGEDTDFYWKLIRSGWRGKHVDEALFHYGKEGQRAKQFMSNAEHDAIMRRVTARYRNKLGCGCEDIVDMTHIYGLKQAGDVVAIANWAGNRTFAGKATGRQYGRMGNQKPFWCDPRDLAAMRDRLLPAPQRIPKRANGLAEIAAAMFKPPAAIEYKPLASVPADATPDFERVIELYKRAN